MPPEDEPVQSTLTGEYQTTLSGGIVETELVNVAEHGREGVRMIDRSTRFGNPFKMTKDGGEHTRERSIKAYRGWFREQLEDDEFHAAVEQLRGETLGCWCTPKPCHCDAILEYLRGGMNATE